MEMLTIELINPKAKRLIDDLAELGLILVKDAKPTWNERWSMFSATLPNAEDITDAEINQEISAVRNSRAIL